MFIKRGGRTSFRSNRRSNYKKNNNIFSVNKPRVKGNISQQHEKYLKLAKESVSSGDRIQSEYYFQFADHYLRLMTEFGIKSNESENNIDKENYTTSQSQSESLSEKNEKKLNPKDSVENDSETAEENNDQSIESVSFIAKPAKKKSYKK